MIGDDELIALCAFCEANLEPDDGVAAVVRVILNRMAMKFQSDGTVRDTVLHGNGTAFSWAAWDMRGGKYVRVANGPDEIEARVEAKLAVAKGYSTAWARAVDISTRVRDGIYSGVDYARLTDDTVLYVNLGLASPVWAKGENLVCRIGRHSFYRAAHATLLGIPLPWRASAPPVLMPAPSLPTPAPALAEVVNEPSGQLKGNMMTDTTDVGQQLLGLLKTDLLTEFGPPLITFLTNVGKANGNQMAIVAAWVQLQGDIVGAAPHALGDITSQLASVIAGKIQGLMATPANPPAS